MTLHQIIKVSGCITEERYIKGKTLSEMERILGFQKGRLEKGVVVAVLMELPSADQFDLLGYSQVAAHKFGSEATKNLDVNKLKEMVIKDKFTLVGHRRLVKVIPNTPHNDQLNNDLQYPPGDG